MLDTLYALAPYAPIVVFCASFLDIFFATGLLLYGAAMLGSVAMMHSTGMISTGEIIIAGFLGTTLGNCANYTTGRLFANTAIVQKYLHQPRIATAAKTLKTRGLFWYMVIGRFITFTRPLYALVLGSINTSFSRFILYESFIALFWICFWLALLLQGERLWFYFLS